ncbi:MAG: alpha/beta fold hydrolase, partial [Candidatus Binatia bacterium]
MAEEATIAAEQAAPRPGFRTDERPEWLDPHEYPFTSREIEIEGCRVHYVDEGNGPVMLMLHGNPTWSFLYREVIKGLRDDFRCIALDYPGFGLSTAPRGYGFTPEEHARIVERFVASLELANVTLMVHDWGGPIGFGAATRDPGRYAAFVIGNSWAWPMTENRDAERLSGFLGGPVGGFLIRDLNLFVRLLMPAVMRRRKLTREAKAAYRGPFRSRSSRRPLHVFPRAILASTAFLEEVESGLGTLRDRPALLVWGDRDPVFRTDVRERWERLFERRHTVILPGAGHFTPEEAPEEIVSAIRDWRGLAGAPWP